MISRITKAVQVTPFIYSSIFVVVFFIYNFAGEKVLDVLDAVFYVSPLMMSIFWVYSRILFLCRWHRVCCVIPAIPWVVSILDSFFNLSQHEVLTMNLVTIIMMVLLLVSAYKVFIGCKKTR